MRLFLALVLMFTFANPLRSQAVPNPVAAIEINPETLRKQLLESNIPILIAMNQVQIAKQQVNLARAQLLPSLNLGALLSSVSSFGLSNVVFLLPFLLPTNWFALAESKHLFEAEKEAFLTLQLNTYASALSIYYTILSDKELVEKLNIQFQTSKQIYDYVKEEYDLGIASETDLNQARSQMQIQQIQYSQTTELVIKEIAMFRQMLSLPLDTKIALQQMHTVTMPEEAKTPQELLPHVLSIAPEKSQIKELISASKSSKWSKAFSFLSSFSLSTEGGSGNAFGGIAASGSANLGFGTFVTYKISNLEAKALEQHDQAIDFQQAFLLESTLGSLNQARMQLDLAVQAESNLNSVYESELLNYRLGISDFLHVLTAANAAVNSSYTKIKVQSDVDNLRVALSRAVIRDQFEKVKKCDLSKVTKIGKTGFFDHIGNFFSDNNKEEILDIDKACNK